MNGSGETRWMDDPELPSQILSTPIVPTPNTVKQRNVTKLDVGTSFVPITISRATAEGWITEAYDTTDRKAVLVALACRAALEEER